MSKVTIREWYARTNAEWDKARALCGGTLPIPTADEAIKGARKLYRFATGRTWTGPVRVTSGRRSTWIRNGVFVVNPNGRDYAGKDDEGKARYLTGWETIVHCLSHYAHNGKPHCKAQALLESRMIREVIKRGFLTGALRGDKRIEVAGEMSAVFHDSALHEQVAAEQKAQARRVDALRNLECLNERIKRWESKQRRAENALAKLRKQVKLYERKLVK